MIRAILVEDDNNNKDVLLELLAEHSNDIEIVGEANSVSNAIDLIKDKEPSLVFLDIDLPDGTAFDILNALNPTSFSVVFVTAHDSFALKAIKYSALDYLLKPIDPDEIDIAIKKVKQTVNISIERKKIENLIANSKGKTKRLAIPTSESIELIDIDQIVWLKAESAYTRIKVANGTTSLFSKNLKYFESLLDEEQFFRAHHSTMINMENIQRFVKQDGGKLIMSNGDEVPVSSRRRSDLMSRLSMIG